MLWVLVERDPMDGERFLLAWTRFPDDLDMEKARLLTLLPDTLLGGIS